VKTEDLISVLAADGRQTSHLGRSLLIALVAGALIAGLAFFATLGFRHDIDSAMHTTRFLFKFLVTLSLAAAAIAVVWRIGRPGVPLALQSWALVVPVVLLLAAVAIEMMVMPEADWSARMIGRNWMHCLMAIPAFSIPTLAALLYVLRESAPSNPALAGAVAGLVSAGVAATYYASNCTDDSPMFVATWYTLAVLIVTLAGAALGRRLLQW
jgi:hypothetical protein